MFMGQYTERWNAVDLTADLLTQRLAVHEQAAWMLRSLLKE